MMLAGGGPVAARAPVHRLDWLIAATIAVAAFALFHLVVARTSQASVDMFFGSDAVSNFRQAQLGKYGVFGTYKHLPAVLAYAGLVELLKALGTDAAAAVLAAAAALSALACAVVYGTLRHFGASAIVAVALTLFFAASNSVLTIFGVVETYGLTCIAIAGGLVAIDRACALIAARPTTSVVLAGLAAGFAGLCNAPAGAIIVVYLLRVLQPEARHSLAVRAVHGAAALALALACSAGVYTAIRWERFSGYLVQYGERYTSLANLLDPLQILNVAAGALLFAFVSPLERQQEWYTYEDLARFWNAGENLAVLVAALLLVGLAMVMIRRTAREDLVREIAACLLVMLAFYTFFNPAEILLYASQTTLLVVVLMGHGFRRAPWTALPTFAVAGAMLAINLGVVLA